VSETLAAQLALLPDYLSRHLLLSVTALGIGIASSLPLAFAVARVRALRGPVLMLASVVQTIPGLALLALMVPLLSRIGFLPAVIALILYSILPVLRNTVTGIQEVDADLIEAGLGLGMTSTQLLLKVELPLALPVIVAGIRTATVWVVGMATLSTPVGATSLGNYIFSGLQTQNYTAVLVGCIAAALLALTLDRLIRSMEIALSRRNRKAIVAAIAATVVVLGAGLSPILLARSSALPHDEVVIGAKTFTEQYILANLIADELDSAGFQTRTLESLGSTVAFDALVAGRIDCYVDYTGTIWVNYMKRTDNPGREAILAGVREWLEDQGIDLVAALGFENAYAFAMTRSRAAALGVRTIDDLVPYAPRLKLGGDYEFFGRPEWRDLMARYGLAFAKLVTMDSSLMYSAAATGEVDAISAFSTDGRIPAYDLVVLEDTRAALPPYDAVLLVNSATLQRVPALRAALAPLAGAIDGDAMRAANKHVDVDGGTVTEAARVLAAGLDEAASR
jgi:osmoprotectant transport system substrate-binding protein/osmoprotectant transport system permease protein